MKAEGSRLNLTLRAFTLYTSHCEERAGLTHTSHFAPSLALQLLYRF